jgi:glycosyltransferase involved in cell wall biosynthesis
VKYNGYISNNKISEYYKRNDVFLFTSRREPFGRVIIEALASKLIIICTKTYGSIEILKKKEFAFFLNKLNTLEIENKINEVYELWRKKPQKFNDLKEAAKRYAIEKYDHSHELKGFIKLINSII